MIIRFLVCIAKAGIKIKEMGNPIVFSAFCLFLKSLERKET